MPLHAINVLLFVYCRGYAIGELKLTNHIHKLLHCYRTGNIPTVWKTFVILVSDMKFVTCLSNLTTRFQQLLTLVDTFLQQKSTLPKDIPADMHFTLGKFFHPDAFLMASRQYSAQVKKQLTLETLFISYSFCVLY